MARTSTTLAPSSVRAARELRVGVSRLRRRLRDSTDRRDLTPSQTSVLSRLDKDGPTSASELAVAERVRPQSMATTIAVLVERSLVDRRPDPNDGRRQLVSVSRSGRAFLDDTRRTGEEWLANALQERLTEAERQTVIKALALLDRLSAP